MRTGEAARALVRGVPVERTHGQLCFKATQEEGVTVFWVCLSPCLYEQTEIASYQAAHNVGRPLDQLKKTRRRLRRFVPSS